LGELFFGIFLISLPWLKYRKPVPHPTSTSSIRRKHHGC
jgi:hypothetical protein